MKLISSLKNVLYCLIALNYYIMCEINLNDLRRAEFYIIFDFIRTAYQGRI